MDTYLPRDANLDLSDLLIVVSATHSGADAILTFDVEAAESSRFELIHPQP